MGLHPRIALVACVFAVLGASGARAAEPALTPEAVEFFEKRIRPIFAAHCYECHSAPAKEKGQLAAG